MKQSKQFLPNERLKRAREQRNWSQATLAAHLGTVPAMVSRWERGMTVPSPFYRERLCALFDTLPQDLGLLSEETGADDIRAPSPLSAPALVASPFPCFDPDIPCLPVKGIVGREKEVTLIKARLRAAGTLVFTALNGMPGIGKTALAVAIARDPELSADFPDGVLWVGLGPQPDMLASLSRWGALLGLSAMKLAKAQDQQTRALLLHDAIGERRMLVIIDDAWSIEDALAFKLGGAGCVYVLTTRFGDIATRFAGEEITVRELNEADGVTLLARLAPVVVRTAPAEARWLVQATGGLPLALTLIGRHLHMQTRTGQPRRLRAALERLHRVEERLRLAEPQSPLECHTSSLPPGSPLSLQTVIAVSDHHLDSPTQAALYALSIFPAKPNTFAEEAALLVAGISGETLDTLCDAGMVESSGPGRYSLHQTIADYARLRLDALEGEQVAAIQQRFCDYFVRFVETHSADYETLEQERANIAAAVHDASTHALHTTLARLATGFTPFLLARGLYSQAELQLQRARAALPAINEPALRASIVFHLGLVAQKRCEYAQAETFLREGLEIAQRLGLTEQVCAFLAKLGWIAEKRGLYHQAETFLREGVALARQHGFHHYLPDLLNELGTVADDFGHIDQAITYYQEGLDIAREQGNREQACVLLLNLGVVVFEQGNLTQADSYYLEGVALARQIGHREYMSILLLDLGVDAQEQGNFAQAETYYQEGLLVARDLDHREWISHLLENLGSLALTRGDGTQAEMYLKEALTLADEIKKPWLTAEILYYWGNLCLHQQHIDEAAETYQHMLVSVPDGNQTHIALAQYGLSRVAASRGDMISARELGNMSLCTIELTKPQVAGEVRQWLASLLEPTNQK